VSGSTVFVPPFPFQYSFALTLPLWQVFLILLPYLPKVPVLSFCAFSHHSISAALLLTPFFSVPSVLLLQDLPPFEVLNQTFYQTFQPSKQQIMYLKYCCFFCYF